MKGEKNLARLTIIEIINRKICEEKINEAETMRMPEKFSPAKYFIFLKFLL